MPQDLNCGFLCCIMLKHLVSNNKSSTIKSDVISFFFLVRRPSAERGTSFTWHIRKTEIWEGRRNPPRSHSEGRGTSSWLAVRLCTPCSSESLCESLTTHFRVSKPRSAPFTYETDLPVSFLLPSRETWSCWCNCLEREWSPAPSAPNTRTRPTCPGTERGSRWWSPHGHVPAATTRDIRASERSLGSFEKTTLNTDMKYYCKSN